MSSATGLEDRANALGYAIKRAQHALRLRMDGDLQALGLTTPQYSVLSAIEANPGISNAQLARQAFVTPQTMQAILAGLERQALLVRTPDATHGRILRSLLTARGAALLAEAHQRLRGVGETLLGALGGLDSAVFLQALNGVADALVASRPPAGKLPPGA